MRSRVVLITGGSGGIGSAVARTFAENGYRVAIQYCHNGTAAIELAEELKNLGADAVCVQADLSSMEGAVSAVEWVEKNFGRVDVLINNAGIAMQKLFIDMTEADWKRMFAVDVDSVFYCTKAVLDGMLREHNGVIINISSMWGQVGASMETAYSAAKAAMIGLTKALAKELGPNGIRVNCVAPGVIDTPMNRMLSDETMEELKEETPLMTIGTPTDVAETCLFLAGESGRFYTGQVLAPNGGMVI